MANGLLALPLLHPELHLQRIEEAFGGALTHRTQFLHLPSLRDREPGLDNEPGLLNALQRQFRTSPRVGC